jgi:REP element-mobilizing transposase RayT
MKNTDVFQAEHFYHVFNRTNGKEPLFRSEDNYRYFLKRYAEYIEPVAVTYAYCLLGNHFHLLVRIRTEAELTNFSPSEKPESQHQTVSRQFRRFFNAYSKAFNKQHGRHGSLFQRPFKRVAITHEVKFANLVYYIHANPTLHGIVQDFRTYPWSSYASILSKHPTRLARMEILEWFGGKEGFIDYHNVQHQDRIESWILE